LIKKGLLLEENLVKKVCTELKLTQKELAEELEIPRGTIGRWVSTNHMPKTAKIALKLMLKNKELVDKLEVLKLFKDMVSKL